MVGAEAEGETMWVYCGSDCSTEKFSTRERE